MLADTVELRVRYGETDRMGVVYNAHFLTYFEVGRTEYLRRFGMTYRDLEEQGALLPVVEAHCRYAGPATYDDLLVMTTWCSRLRPTRIDFRHRIVQASDGALVAEGHIVLACVDEDRRLRRLPEPVRRAIEVCEGGPCG